MIRNLMFLVAMGLGITGCIVHPQFLFAGAVVAVTTMFMRFKEPPQPPRPIEPPKPHVPTDPIDVLQSELEMLDSQMDSISIDEMDDATSASVIIYTKLAENRDKVAMALVDLIIERKENEGY